MMYPIQFHRIEQGEFKSKSLNMKLNGKFKSTYGVTSVVVTGIGITDTQPSTRRDTKREKYDNI
jgi:hypothetical protein